MILITVGHFHPMEIGLMIAHAEIHKTAWIITPEIPVVLLKNPEIDNSWIFHRNQSKIIIQLASTEISDRPVKAWTHLLYKNVRTRDQWCGQCVKQFLRKSLHPV